MHIIFIILALIASVYYWYIKNIRIDVLRKKKTSLNKPIANEKKQRTPNFACVILHAGEQACQAARLIEAKPILMNEASLLPLNNCNVVNCHCGYLRYKDRRTGSRRRDLSGAERFAVHQKNRRAGRDRRMQPNVS